MIYIAKPSGDVLGVISGIKEETCNLKRTLTDMWELSFEVTKYIDANNFELSDYYDSIVEKMRIRLETDLIDTMFVIDSEPVVSNNGIQETKTVTAHTIECELQHKFLRSFYINNGTPTSQEYLAKNNINSYTQLPNEYISLVNFENHELSLLHLALENTEWTIDENLKETELEMCAKKFTFSIDEKDIYSFLMNNVAKTAQIIFLFDRKNHIISFKSFENLGEDTGIFIGLRNLANQIDIESTAEYGLITKYKPTCSESLGIEYVNFGDPYMYNMDYFANTHNEYGDFKYVTESFHNEYTQWMKKREENRQTFIDLTKEYNKNIIKIDELKNRLPNDGCSIDYKTYKADELYLSLNAYENAVATLLTLYKDEYKDIYTNQTVPLNENHLKTTMYWNDYYSYRYQIIPSVLEAMKIWYKTDSYGNLMVGDDGKYILCVNGNPAYANNVNIVKPIDSFKYEFELYGLDELNSKKMAWMECANLLYKDGFIKSGTVDNPIAYSTPDETGWNNLTAQQKLQFTTFSAFKDNLNNYLDYTSFNARENSITGTNCKGIIRQCEDAIAQRQTEISTLQTKNDAIQKNRNTLSSSVLPENNFSSDNLKIFRLLIHEDNYTNENIVTTSLDDIVSTIDVAEELYQDAKNQLFIVSQPQYCFKSSIDNLFALEEFSSYTNEFKIGNFIKLLPDIFSDEFVKLRIISIESNPLIETNDFTVEISTMTKSLLGINDLAFLFDSNNYSDTSTSYGGSSSSGGTYGKNDAEIQIANNMLNALLKTETFGTQISDIILDSIKTNRANFGKLIAHSGIFDSLESGEIKVNGACLTDIIKSLDYLSGSSGSMFNLKDGSIDFGGGSLTYTPKKGLSIKGFASDSSVTSLSNQFTNLTNGLSNGTTNINGSCISTGFIKSNNWNGTASNPTGNTQGSIISLSDGKFNFGGGNLKWDGTNIIINGNGKFTGEIQGTSGAFNGSVTATTLTANQTGNIAGWTFNKNGFYKNNQNIDSANGMYIGNDGISVGKNFVAKNNGLYIKSNDWQPTTFSSQIGNETGLGLDYLPAGGYMKIYIYNIGNIDYYQMSWQLNLDLMATKDNEQISFSMTHYCIRGYGVNGRTESQTDNLYYDGEDLVIMPVSNQFIINDINSSINDNYYKNNGYSVTLNNIYFKRIYSYGRTINRRYFNTVQIGKIEFYNANGTLYNTFYGTRTNQITGMIINTFTRHIYSEKFRLSNDEFLHSAVYDNVSSGSSNVFIGSDGIFKRSSSSSKRYKTDINKKIPDNLSPQKLYDLDIVSYKYKDGYLNKKDQRYKKNVIGFIAEDVYEKYPIACNLDEDGNPEMWNINILFPVALKLIQEQHEEIENLKKRIEILEQKI